NCLSQGNNNHSMSPMWSRLKTIGAKLFEQVRGNFFWFLIVLVGGVTINLARRLIEIYRNVPGNPFTDTAFLVVIIVAGILILFSSRGSRSEGTVKRAHIVMLAV